MAKSQQFIEIINVSPFSTKTLTTWDDVCRNAIGIYSGSLDSLLACFISTTRELKQPFRRYAYILWAIPFWTICTLLTIPLGIIFMLLWLPIARLRVPYRYSYVKDAQIARKKDQYTCVTTNVCFLYECLTRFNNQQDTFNKAIKIGKSIASQQEDVGNDVEFDSTKGLGAAHIEKLRDEKLASIGVSHREENIDGYWEKLHMNRKGKSQHATNGHNHQINGSQLQCGRNNNSIGESNFDHSILCAFPPTDFLLIQETWDIESARALAKELHRVYPFIVYDAREDGFSSNFFLLGSGAMIASKYPIMDVRFQCYRCGIKQCRLASKGLLQVKVDLGKSSTGKQAVGYLATTHLQAYQGTHPIHSIQMDKIIEGTEGFRRESQNLDELVCFDIVGGDFNTDNMSPVDQMDWDHKLFQIYEDVCRDTPGVDQPWTVGTEMTHTPLDDPLIQTPLGLHMALSNPFLLQHYVLDADIANACLEIAHLMPQRDEKGEVILSPVGGRRRIDYILFRKGDGVNVTACNVVTQLAGLTDHIPVSLTFNVRQ